MNNNMIIEFLRDLKENNSKEWFEHNKSRYEQVKKTTTSWQVPC